MQAEFWLADWFGRAWLRLHPSLRPRLADLPEECARVARGEQLSADRLWRAQDFAVRVWWRVAMTAMVIGFGVAAAVLIVSRGRIGNRPQRCFGPCRRWVGGHCDSAGGLDPVSVQPEPAVVGGGRARRQREAVAGLVGGQAEMVRLLADAADRRRHVSDLAVRGNEIRPSLTQAGNFRLVGL
jgi:hypothetical protein